MNVTKEWLSNWELKREKLSSPVDFNEYYTSSNIAGREIDILNIGYCSIPSGELLVRDPMCYLTSLYEKTYFQTVPKGEFLVELCVVKATKDECARYATARIRFTEAEAVRFEEALIGYEDLDDLGEDDYYGFNVDAGLACICDKTVHRAYCDFHEKWHIEHENEESNIYTDYFADLFKKSYKISPKHQRSGGDWINWKIPGSNFHMPIFTSGFGDGTYPVYWGYDKDGSICQMIVEFIDIRLAYEEEEDSMDTEEIDNKIKPFFWVEHSSTVSVCLNVGEYLQDIFDTRANEGFEGGGYDWASLAQVFLEECRPDLKNTIKMDPEASMFVAYSQDNRALHDFVLSFKDACENKMLILDLFSRAELD